MDAMRYRASNQGVVPYMAIPLVGKDELLPISQVILGPTQDVDAGRETTASFLRTRGYEDCAICDSEIPYRGLS